MTRFFCLVLLWGFSFSALHASETSQPDLTLNDVSILLPYKERPELFNEAPRITTSIAPWILKKIEVFTEADRTLRLNEEFQWANRPLPPDDAREFKNLLPFSGADFPQGEGLYEQDQLIRDLALVSVRFDPCANVRSASQKSDCNPEVRLVWQQIDARRRPAFVDANVHSIHSLSQKQFQKLLFKLRALVPKLSADEAKVRHDLPLMPQPEIAREGLKGPYYKGLMAIIQEFANASSLSHIAFFAQTLPSGHWPLLKFSVKGNKAEVLPIPLGTVGEGKLKTKSVQRLSLSDFEGMGPASPERLGADSLSANLSLEERLDHIARVENPNFHDSSELDCASCHRAELDRRRIEKEFPQLEFQAKDAYISGNWNLTTRYPATSISTLQLFSYFPPMQVRIAARTIHETAAAADAMNSQVGAAP